MSMAICSSTIHSHIKVDQRIHLRTSVLPTLLNSIAEVGKCLRESLHIQAVGSTNTSGDNQLNVDLATNEVIHKALRTCPSILSASSEEDAGESPVQHTAPSPSTSPSASKETYAVAFDPLDGSSIIPANWSVGTIIGVWDGSTALRVRAREKQIAAILGVLGPRTTAIVAVRLPGSASASPAPLCFEVGLPAPNADIHVLRETVKFAPHDEIKTRYFAPANLRAAAQDSAYKSLLDYFIASEYTLRYSGGLVPDVYHAFVKGHGVYVSPVTEKSKAKLRVLYEVAPIALIVECAGGRAVDAGTGEGILEKRVEDVDDRSGLVCGTSEEVELVMRMLKGA
ncbi:sedoheptulose-1,7-bisphosphatase [Bimuria novae-zelandiae CBS 107.79]|uniref:Sedoheptulose-1,7-bisphosphatase n=1 Tax=Bimuria novae-zelandiae CBS 107.79 TaxID=1447943 RepID=A0A6A5URB9_9PLEO|nr:sedoheptulose-1,7-bisphosphatase [Bimuria novae-zelandiae CBS 107.79]